MNVLVSIIVPVYNKEKTLYKCVDSILNQTYKNIEIIIINDGSTDNSYNICERLSKKDIRVKVLHTENNGVSVARNLGIKLAKGTYLTFVDSDDEISPLFIDKMINISLKRKCDIIVCCALINDDDKKEKNRFFSESNFYVSKRRAIAQLYSNNYYNDADNYIDVGVPWGKFYKKEFIIRNKILFNPKLRRMQDSIFNLNAFYNASNIYYVDYPLYYYNLENIKQSKFIYIEDADTLFLSVAKEMYDFYLLYYKNDLVIKQLVNQRIFNLYLIILRNKICHPEIKKDYKEIPFLIEKFSNTYPFKNIISEISYKHISHESTYVEVFSRLVLLFLKNKNYRSIFLLYQLYYKWIVG